MAACTWVISVTREEKVVEKVLANTDIDHFCPTDTGPHVEHKENQRQLFTLAERVRNPFVRFRWQRTELPTTSGFAVVTIPLLPFPPYRLNLFQGENCEELLLLLTTI